MALTALAGCTTASGGLPLVSAQPTSSSQTVTSRALLSALDGGLIGRIAALELRGADRTTALEAEYRALEYTAPAQPVYWQASGRSVSGTVVPSQPYRVGTQDCRQYTVLISQSAGTSEQTGTACRNEDGSWALLS